MVPRNRALYGSSWAEIRAPWVTSKSFDGSDNATSFHVLRGPVPLGIIAADIWNGPSRTVRLSLFERGIKTVDTGVAVHVKGAGVVSYGAPVREGQLVGQRAIDRNSTKTQSSIYTDRFQRQYNSMAEADCGHLHRKGNITRIL